MIKTPRDLPMSIAFALSTVVVATLFGALAAWSQGKVGSGEREALTLLNSGPIARMPAPDVVRIETIRVIGESRQVGARPAWLERLDALLERKPV
jgi:hypothetical protein